MNNLKIAYIIPSLDFTGPIIFTKYLIEGIKSKVACLEVFYFRNSKKIDLGVKCTQISFFKSYDFSSFDIIHTTMAKPDLYGAIYIDKSKWVSSIHNFIDIDMKMLFNPFQAFYRIIFWKSALKFCQNVIVSSKAMYEYYRSYIGNKNYSIISYGIENKTIEPIDLDDVHKLDEFRKQNKIIIGSVGNIIPRKGFIQLVHILENNPNTGCVIIGDGIEKENIIGFAEEKKVAGRLMILGFRKESKRYYKYIDIYAHVSYSEGFGLAMLEALEKGIPIICSNLDIYKDYFGNEDVSYFEPGKLASLEAAFQNIVKNYEKYKYNAKSLFNKYFTLKNMAKNHIQFYEKIRQNND